MNSELADPDAAKGRNYLLPIENYSTSDFWVAYWLKRLLVTITRARFPTCEQFVLTHFLPSAINNTQFFRNLLDD